MKASIYEFPPFPYASTRKVFPWKSDGNGNGSHPAHQPAEEPWNGIVGEMIFNRLLTLERKRTERTGHPFVLMLLNFEKLAEGGGAEQITQVCEMLCAGTRDTDVAGWYEHPTTMGILFTALGGNEDREVIQSALAEKTIHMLREMLEYNDLKKVLISFHFFPEKIDGKSHSFHGDEALYPDLEKSDKSNAGYHRMKRVMDISGSLLALILFSPFFLLIPILIKLTSRGPVLFKQQRMGKFGNKFLFLKFRTMFINNDAEIHRNYVKSLIDQQGKPASEGKKLVFKIVNDPRITPIGHFLRKTSLDELPQFFNVLCGEMSLVGPRPPIPYEVTEYHSWHRRRLLEVKPGITGLWQVYGRSRTTFDEMVRLDLRYARHQSIWLDIKLLVKTPLAIVSGVGAY